LPETDLSLLVTAAEKAGEIGLRFFRADPKVWDKGGDAGPVTEADLAINAHLVAALRQARPDYGWLSEETEDSEDRLVTETQFVVDPIDGTRAFVEGSENWAIALATVTQGAPQTAVVYLPAKGLLFAAARGDGATLNGKPLAVSSLATCDGATVLSNKPSFQNAPWTDGTPPAGLERHFRSSLAYRLCLVAQGRFDAMMTMRRTWEWDIAAGALIVAEAGGTALDIQNQPLVFNNPHPQVNGVIAGGAVAVHIRASLTRDNA